MCRKLNNAVKNEIYFRDFCYFIHGEKSGREEKKDKKKKIFNKIIKISNISKEENLRCIIYANRDKKLYCNISTNSWNIRDRD